MTQISLESIKKTEKYRSTVHDKAHTTYTVIIMDDKNMFSLICIAASSVRTPEK